MAPRVGKPKGGSRTEGVTSDSKLLGLARMLVNMGADGVQGEGLRRQGSVLMLQALALLSRSPHKPQTMEDGRGDAQGRPIP